MAETGSGDRAVLRPPSVQGATAGSIIFGPTPPSAPMTLDETDTAVLTFLLDDGKMTNREVAQRTGISESAVSVRLRKLINSGILVFSAVFDWEVAGFEWFVICRIKTRIRGPRLVCDDILQLPQCEAATVVLGSHDIIAYFLATDRDDIGRVIDWLSNIEGIAKLDVDLATDTTVNRHGRQLFLALDVPPIRLPAPRIELDELDIAILQALVEDGRQSSRNIARAFDVSEGTVRARITRMTQAGLMRVVAMVEPVALGMAGVIASVSVRAERSRLDAIVKELMALPHVVFAARCLGSCDIQLTVIATDARELMDLVGSTVQSVAGVLATDALLFVDVVRFSPYMKRLTNGD
ncbi:Lrp/AsnC family transcriptional regulator [Mycobacterium intracellulare]|uniref:Lrp/AsnC family transcriptional regulator n=1 Tax=Mycobacterium intracellulare TaxID=1767 RepID=UPI0034D43257